VDAEVLRKYVERQGDGCFADTRPSESKRRLPEAVRDVYELIERFRQTDAATLESYGLLQRIFHEQCEVTDDSSAPVVVRPPRTSDCDGVINPADPDARYNKHRGTGYLVQIMETFAEDDSPEEDDSQPAKPDLVTHVAVDKLTMHDQDALEPALDDADQRGVKPKELLADSHYGCNRFNSIGPAADNDSTSTSNSASFNFATSSTSTARARARTGRSTERHLQTKCSEDGSNFAFERPM